MREIRRLIAIAAMGALAIWFLQSDLYDDLTERLGNKAGESVGSTVQESPSATSQPLQD